jgi:serine/threonine protein kinase
VLLYELVVGSPPFYSEDIHKIYESVVSLEVQFPKKITLSNEVKDLITKLMCKDPSRRLGC